MNIVCCDLEGVFVPEIWINVSQTTGIEKLNLTTRDIPDYDVLMQNRLAILKENYLKINDIQDVIAKMEPLEGAREFLDWLRERTPVIVVSDTFEQFAGPLMKKLGWPTLFCNTLQIDGDGTISDYILRQKDGKRHVVLALKSLNYRVIAFGDSYNDIGMIQTADKGLLFRPPASIAGEFPQFPTADGYDTLKTLLRDMGV